MSKSEYIIWKCETIEQIREEHPEWNEEQVLKYFSAVETKLKRSGLLKLSEDEDNGSVNDVNNGWFKINGSIQPKNLEDVYVLFEDGLQTVAWKNKINGVWINSQSGRVIKETPLYWHPLLAGPMSVSKNMKAIDIQWDTDGDTELLSQLPTEMEIPEGIVDEDEMSEYLTEQTGFCHFGFHLIDTVSGL